MSSWLWMLLPDEALAIVLIGLCVAWMLGLVRGRAVWGFLGAILLVAALSPFVEALFSALPLWASLLIMAWIALSLLRWLAGALLGRQASNEMVGSLAASVVRAIFVLPFRTIGWIFGRR